MYATKPFLLKITACSGPSCPIIGVINTMKSKKRLSKIVAPIYETDKLSDEAAITAIYRQVNGWLTKV
jgi:hypothetical protein